MHKCASCKTSAVKHICGHCYRQAYCGTECQERDWYHGNHSYQCIAGQEEPDAVNFMDLPTDLLRYVIPKHLDAKDLKNLSTTSLALNRIVRAKYYESLVWKVGPSVWNSEASALIAEAESAGVVLENVPINPTNKEFLARDWGEVLENLPTDVLRRVLRVQKFESLTNHIKKIEIYEPVSIDWMEAFLKKFPFITHIMLHRDFNEPLQGVFLEGLTHLRLGYMYQQDIKGALPQSLTHLWIGGKSGYSQGSMFRRDVNGALPQGLTHLYFLGFYPHSLVEALPLSIQYILMNSQSKYLEELRAYCKNHSIVLSLIETLIHSDQSVFKRFF